MAAKPSDLEKTLQEDRLPECFGRYRIVKRLGQGGMGSVYLAHDAQLDRPVALKVPRFTADVSSSMIQRFFTEARAAATIHHPNLCPVYDVGEINGRHYLTMAYIEGKPLSAYTQRWPVREAAAVVRKLALALQEAHAKGVIHRDLKPSNVMINHRSEPVLMDFGLARRSTGDARLTQEGTVLGTPAYMAPEQVQGDVAAMGPGCDIYGLGVILYELLAGRPPFEGSPMSVLAQIMTQEPAPPAQHRPDLDPRLGAICLKAMAKKVTDRYPNMAAFAAALTDFLRSSKVAISATLQEGPAAGLPVDQAAPTQAFDQYPTRPDSAAVPAKRGPVGGRWAVVAGAAVTVVVLAGVALFVWLRKGKPEVTAGSPAGEAVAAGKKSDEGPPEKDKAGAEPVEGVGGGGNGPAPKAPLTLRKAANRNYGTEQATGEPDTWPNAGDAANAWASLSEDDRDEWLLLEYAQAVVPKEIHVYETFNPGAVYQVTVFDAAGKEAVAWSGEDPTRPDQEKGISKIPLRVDFAVKYVKVYLASTKVKGWNEIDAVGLVDREDQPHWATAAAASSTWASDVDEPGVLFAKPEEPAGNLAAPWSAMQVTGKPDTWPNAGDLGTAWASKTPDDQDEWLLLEYARAVIPKEVLVYETFNPGAVAKVTVFNAAGKEVVAWTGQDPTRPNQEKGVSKIHLATSFATKRVKVYLDSKRVPGWNEIDAVGLVDNKGKVHWAVSATASSSYADP